MNKEQLSSPRSRKSLSFKKWSAAVRKARITSSTQYRKVHKKYKGWPSTPNKTYKKHKFSWPVFFGKTYEPRGRNAPNNYPKTYSLWLKKIKELGILTSGEYFKIAIGNENFPSNPNIVYKKYWKGWKKIFRSFGKKLKKKRLKRLYKKYMSYTDLKAFLEKIQCKKHPDYQLLSQQNEKIPSAPRVVYKKEWISWKQLFGL